MTGPSAPRTPAIDERAFHAWLGRQLTGRRQGLLPMGDDAAALRVPRGRVAVLSTDALVEGTHFLEESPPGLVGAAAAHVSLSDIGSKGAEPAALLLELIVPPGTPRRWAEAVVRGAHRAGTRFGAPLVGGDTKPGPARVVVSTVLGWGQPGRLAPRSGARRGDLLVTTGSVGRGGLAAHLLGRATLPGRTRLATLRALLEVHPRVREGIAVNAFAHATLDTSDGIADAAGLLAAASGVRVIVEEGRLPLARGVAAASRSRAERRAIAFFGGDYELLSTLRREDLSRAVAAVRRAGCSLTVIGRIERGRGAWLDDGNRTARMPAGGWRPFRAGGARLP
jgi:thiamine-monophosphate kinase